VIVPWKPPSANNHPQAREPLHSQVGWNCHCSEKVWSDTEVSGLASVRTESVRNTPSIALSEPPAHSFVDHEIDRACRECKIQIQVIQCEIESGCLGTGSQSKTTPAAVPLSRTTSSIYRKLYQGYLARRILRHKPTILNRRTRLNLCKSDDEDAGDEESGAEKAQRTLRLLGIEMSHTPISWKQRQFIETNPLGKSRCYRPSFLRWSWTIVEKRESKAIPIEEE
jgi:hypothetical protein